MMSCQMKKRYFGAVRDEKEVSPANIDTDSDYRNGEDDDYLNIKLTSAIQASSVCLLGRDDTPWECSNPVSSGHAVYSKPRNSSGWTFVKKFIRCAKTFHF